MKKSRVYKVEGRLFRYDFDNCLVEYLIKADEQMIQDNKEWFAKFNSKLWDIDDKGYCIIDEIGLRLENWQNKEVRLEYLTEYARELEYETKQLVDDFIKYEMPYL